MSTPDDLVEVRPPSGWYVCPDELEHVQYWNGDEFGGKRKRLRDIPSAKPFPGVRRVPRSALPLPPQPAEDLAARIVVTPALELPGLEIVSHRGEVFGSTVRSRNFFSDGLAGLRNAVGGEARGYTKMLDDARDEAMRRLRNAAYRREADAVVALSVTTSQIMGDMVQILAVGAAVSTAPREAAAASAAEQA